MTEIETAVNQLKNRVGIMWQVNQRYDGEDSNPELITDASSKTHELIFPQNYPDAKKDNVLALRLLCLAKLGESRDPIVSTSRFRTKDLGTDSAFVENINAIEDEEVADLVTAVNLGSQISQVWTNDLVRSIDPEIAFQGISEVLDALEPKSETVVPDDMYYYLGYAICNAEIARGLKDPKTKEKYETLGGRLLNLRLWIEENVDEDTKKMVGDLAFLYENVAKLPEDGDEAVKLYEQYVQKTTNIIGLSVLPQIEKDSKQNSVWTFMFVE
jgi:hypothetical protein